MRTNLGQVPALVTAALATRTETTPSTLPAESYKRWLNSTIPSQYLGWISLVTAALIKAARRRFVARRTCTGQGTRLRWANFHTKRSVSLSHHIAQNHGPPANDDLQLVLEPSGCTVRSVCTSHCLVLFAKCTDVSVGVRCSATGQPVRDDGHAMMIDPGG